MCGYFFIKEIFKCGDDIMVGIMMVLFWLLRFFCYNLVNLKILKIVIYVFWIEVSLEINVI